MNEYRIMSPVCRKAIAKSLIAPEHQFEPLILRLGLVHNTLVTFVEDVKCSVTDLANDKKQDGMLIVSLEVLDSQLPNGRYLRGSITKDMCFGGYGLLSTYESTQPLVEDGSEEQEHLFFNNLRRAWNIFKSNQKP